MDKEKHMSSLYGFISTNGSISLPVIKKNAEAEKNESEDTDSGQWHARLEGRVHTRPETVNIRTYFLKGFIFINPILLHEISFY